LQNRREQPNRRRIGGTRRTDIREPRKFLEIWSGFYTLLCGIWSFAVNFYNVPQLQQRIGNGVFVIVGLMMLVGAIQSFASLTHSVRFRLFGLFITSCYWIGLTATVIWNIGWDANAAVFLVGISVLPAWAFIRLGAPNHD
jgi:hypothetical protein